MSMRARVRNGFCAETESTIVSLGNRFWALQIRDSDCPRYRILFNLSSESSSNLRKEKDTQRYFDLYDQRFSTRWISRLYPYFDELIFVKEINRIYRLVACAASGTKISMHRFRRRSKEKPRLRLFHRSEWVFICSPLVRPVFPHCAPRPEDLEGRLLSATVNDRKILRGSRRRRELAKRYSWFRLRWKSLGIRWPADPHFHLVLLPIL